MKASRELEKVLAHAETRLAPTGKQRPTEVLPLYKKFLKVEEHRLRLRHQAGGGGREICAGRAELVDGGEMRCSPPARTRNATSSTVARSSRRDEKTPVAYP
jgi:hypothetical protein